MLDVLGLSKDYGPRRVVDQVTFRVEKGQILGFLGNNGAGKSTTMKMITGFLQPTEGTARIQGHDIRSESLAARRILGYLPEGVPLYPDMEVDAFLRFIAEVRGYDGADRERRVEEIIETCFLEEVRHQTIDTLSKGYRQRVGFAQAILHDPPVLIMDEPTDGLDPNQKFVVRNLIKRMGSEKVIVLSTHILEEVEEVCTRVILIHRGKLIADDTPAGLKARSRYHNALVFTLEGEADIEEEALGEALSGFDAAASWEMLDRDGARGARLFPAEGAIDPLAFRQFAADRGWPIDALYIEEGRLDDVFRTLTREAEGGLTGLA